MPRCSVPGCSVNSGDKNGHRIFRFPKNRADSDQWISLLRRPSFKPTQNSVVCSKHFIDRRPTEKNPFPVLELGYKVKKLIQRRRTANSKKASSRFEEDTDPNSIRRRQIKEIIEGSKSKNISNRLKEEFSDDRSQSSTSTAAQINLKKEPMDGILNGITVKEEKDEDSSMVDVVKIEDDIDEAFEAPNRPPRSNISLGGNRLLPNGRRSVLPRSDGSSHLIYTRVSSANRVPIIEQRHQPIAYLSVDNSGNVNSNLYRIRNDMFPAPRLPIAPLGISVSATLPRVDYSTIPSDHAALLAVPGDKAKRPRPKRIRMELTNETDEFRSSKLEQIMNKAWKRTEKKFDGMLRRRYFFGND